MVRAWYMDRNEEDQRLEHHRKPAEFVSIDSLYKKTGVEYFQVTPDVNDEQLKELKSRRGYSYEDEVTASPNSLPDYENKLKMFFMEHLHTDEEIRLVLEGSGYFDVRDENDDWIRIEVVPGDLIIIPSGIYHRFTLDSGNYIKVRRFFIGEPVWTPYNRPADNIDARKDYLARLSKQFA